MNAVGGIVMPDPIKVLIVEDRRDDAEIMVLALEADNFDVAWKRVETSEDYLRNLSPEVDVVLADYTLPQFNAFAALGILKDTGLDIPFIVVTGTVSEELAVSCMKQGAADYLLKDRLSRLGEAVRQAIKQRDLRRVQRTAEQALTVFGRAVETSINAIVMVDLQGSITYINRAVLDLWGISGEQTITGKNLSQLLLSPTESARLMEELRQQTSAQGELALAAWNGRQMVLQYAANQVVDGDGQLLCLMLTFIDITEQKQNEVLRLELERERELREVKSRFVSLLVHDFRNPLTSLQMGLSFIDKYYERLTPAQIREKVRAALQQSSQMNQLIDDALMIGKMDHASSRFAPEDINLVDFCRMIFAEFEQSVDSSKHPVSFAAHLPSFIYPTDRALLRRAIINLLTNAVKYSPAGGAVQLGLSLEDQALLISVSDHGIGIPTVDQKHMFDGFHRATNVGTIQGTGLGLATVKQVVDIHGGSIECESELNRGTTFTIKFTQKTPAA
jgi:PAS domain S-box-containing protein